MLKSLYSEAIGKKDYIQEMIGDISETSINIEDKWIDRHFSKDVKEFKVSAGDGSIHKRNFLGFVFYAIATESLVYNSGFLNKLEYSKVDIMRKGNSTSNRLRNYMEIYEIKNGTKTIKEFNPDYYLFDGSIFGHLIMPISMENDIPEDKKIELINLSKNFLDISVQNFKVNIQSNYLENKFKEEIKEYKKYKPIFYLEYIEKFLSLAKLLENKEKVIAISKTSGSTSCFDGKIPDLAIFSRFTKKTGYSLPRYQEVSHSIKHVFPIGDEFFRKLTFTIFYIRLEENKNILKVELPYEADYNDISQVIDVLLKYSIEGYPYLLKKAHDDVIIKKKDIEQLSQIVGLYEKTGREMLN
ncbi:MAG: DNA double-strand break repair nuclease NurA [Methanobrevibacter sp.]|jgi:NurA-like 5'-3' nuclease|nr:DNA double-strand break repair nuclease NurA [Candidatus Methanovirga basalitermitum]